MAKAEPTKDAEVQDNRRERQLADLLDLNQSTRRIGDDAGDEVGNNYELKTTTKTSVGTSRDVGRTYTARMRSRYLIVAKGNNSRYGFQADEIWFLHPEDVSEWIETLEAKFSADETIVAKALEAAGGALTEDERDRLSYLGQRGSTLNNPKISMEYVRTHGTLLEGDPALHLRRLIAERPLTTPEPDASSSDAPAEAPPIL